MHDRSEWTRGPSGPQTIKTASGKMRTYANLAEFKRPCATCGELFSIYVTPKIAAGHADSNSFGLKNCEKHRRNRSLADSDELETLRTANATMREELEGLYAQVQELRGRLAQYDLPAAMRAQAEKPIGCEAVQNTSNGMPPKALTFPWDNT